MGMSLYTMVGLYLMINKDKVGEISSKRDFLESEGLTIINQESSNGNCFLVKNSCLLHLDKWSNELHLNIDAQDIDNSIHDFKQEYGHIINDLSLSIDDVNFGIITYIS